RALVRGRIAASLKPLRRLGRSLGVAHAGADALFDCGHGDGAPMLGLYSPRFGPVQPDHPAGLTLVGFPAYDSETGGTQALDPALAAFLDAGPAPIVFSLGSFAVHAPGDFYRASLQAARGLGRRALLLAGAEEAQRLQGERRGDVFVAAYAPHSQVFPRAAAIVHHGGIGTTAQALRSGRPQLVTPFLGDQHDNARRVKRLGLGRRLRPDRYEGGGATEALRILLGDPAYAAAAEALAPVFRAEDGAAAGALYLDGLLERA
ncbi:glycosyltransferase, partial [Caulobacter sp. D4A]